MNFIKNLSGYNNQGNLSSNVINNLVIFISFAVMIYILVQMIIVLNRPEFLYFTLSPTPTDLSNQSKLKSLEFSDKLPPNIMDEFTYSFWMYLKTIDINSDDHKLVFMRTEATEDDTMYRDANPIVYLQKKTNKLIIKIKTGDDEPNGSNSDDSTPTSSITNSFHESKCAYRTIKINYIPLKRWVNIIINVDNNRITIFLDGDIYKTLLIDIKKPDCAPDVTSTISETKGNIKVGGASSADALISKIQFYNYSLKTPSDIRQIYNDGPVESEGILETLGFEYKFRYPIYKIGEEETCDN
jgi:hypothetical protein